MGHEAAVGRQIMCPLRAQQVAHTVNRLHRSRAVRLPGEAVDHVVAQRGHIHEVQQQHGEAHGHEKEPVAVRLAAAAREGETHGQVVDGDGQRIHRQRGKSLPHPKADEKVQENDLDEIVRGMAQAEAHEPLQRCVHPEGEARRQDVVGQETHRIAQRERPIGTHVGEEHIVNGIMNGSSQDAHHHETAHLFHALIVHSSLQNYSYFSLRPNFQAIFLCRFPDFLQFCTVPCDADTVCYCWGCHVSKKEDEPQRDRGRASKG